MVIKRSGAREHRGESAAFLAIDQHPVCPNTARCELWPRKWFLFGWVDDTRHVDRCKWISTRVRSHQLTSDLREVYCFGYACNGRVWSLVKAVSLPSFVLGGLRGSTATSGSCCFPLSISKPQVLYWARMNSELRQQQLFLEMQVHERLATLRHFLGKSGVIVRCFVPLPYSRQLHLRIIIIICIESVAVWRGADMMQINILFK